MQRSLPPIALALLLASLAGIPGCITDGPIIVDPPKKRPAPVQAAGAPAKMIVSPLTRIGADTISNPSLLLHLDFRDSDEQPIKAFGRLRVELYQTTGGAGSGSAGAPTKQVLAQSWDADLRDPVRNALSFDEMITRTYTVTLGGTPEWLQRWGRKEGDQASTPAPTIIVTYLDGNETSTEKALRVAYTLTR